MTDPRIHAPATARNRDAILAVLRRVLPPRGLVLEVASGSGEHVAHFAPGLPGLVFQPSDPDAARRASVDGWAAGLGNVLPAIGLDAAAPGDGQAAAPVWPVTAADAVICCNMIHIAPWEAAVGLVAGAGRILGAGGVLFLYGPYRRGGRHTAPSNAEFDADLRRRNPAWGVRDLEAVEALAAAAGFGAAEVVAMPANNFSVIFRKEGAG